MTGSAKEKTLLLTAGLLLGALAKLLLNKVPWGINVPLYISSFCGALLLLRHFFGCTLSPNVTRLMPVAIFFAAAFAWRDSDTLKFINGAAVCLVLALAALRSRRGTLAVGWVVEYSVGLVREWLIAPVIYLRETVRMCGWFIKADRKMPGTTLAVIRGLLMALPLLIMFGWLFKNADASYEQFIHSLLDFDLEALLEWLLWLPLWVAICGGVLLRVMQEHDRDDLIADSPCRLGTVETAIVLGLLNLLFLTFIATQTRYFFGGSAMVANAPDLSVAVYARRGFFELVAVTVLVLPILLVIHWLQEEGGLRERQLFRVLAGSLVVMLFAIMASAMHRMFLYQHNFGLTELRLYTTLFMVWLALVFVWFLRTVLFDNRSRFAFGALVAGLGIIALLNALNPDNLIVKVNSARAVSGRSLDCGYLFSLSNDATPAIIEALPLAEPSLRSFYSQRLLTRFTQPKPLDWRCWNWSTYRAEQAVGTHRAELQRMVRR